MTQRSSTYYNRSGPTAHHYIRPSELDREISLVAPGTPTKTADGGTLRTDATPLVVRAKVEYGRAVEDPSSGRVIVTQGLTIMVRNQGLDSLTAEWKIEYDGDTYNVEGYKKIGRATYLEIMAEKETP